MIFAYWLHKIKVSPLKPPANNFTSCFEKRTPNVVKRRDSKRKILNTLFANVSADSLFFLILTYVYNGINPVVTAVPNIVNIMAGIFWTAT